MGSISLASPAAANQSRNCRATARCASEKKVQVKAPVDSDQWARLSARSRMRWPSLSRSSTAVESFNIGLFVVSRECSGKSGALPPRPEEPAKRASRRTAASEIVPVAILRDAVLRTAPQDEVRGFHFCAPHLISFIESLH